MPLGHPQRTLWQKCRRSDDDRCKEKDNKCVWYMLYQGKGKNGKAKAENGNQIRTRATKRSTSGTTTTKKVKKIYNSEDKGCQHDHPDFWHQSSSVYSKPSWNDKHKWRTSLKCSNCYVMLLGWVQMRGKGDGWSSEHKMVVCRGGGD